MKTAQLVGPKDLQIREIPEPGPPGIGEVLIEILSVGICGSDLHMYETGTIGGLKISEPLTLGHEFCARIIATGKDANDEHGNALQAGMRVAVEPHVACGHCEQCIEGNPNLCPGHVFYGVAPTHGALTERMIVQSRNCFPIPEEISHAGGALLETLGVALHATDLGKIRTGDSVAVIGCGPVGALIARLAVLSGASEVMAVDLLSWRTQLVNAWGATSMTVKDNEVLEFIENRTCGRGVDVAIEAAWANHSVQQAIDIVRPGGRVVMAGIPPDDQFHMQHSVARRKGLTIRMARRMKHTYPRAIRLASGPAPKVRLDDLVSNVYPLEQADVAYADNAAYREGLLKGIIKVTD